MREETVDDLKKILSKQQAAHAFDAAKLKTIERVFDVMIAAGVLDRAKFEQARALVEGYTIDA